jgi:hypothetical protein
MVFEALPPDFGTLLRGGSSWDVFGTGEIDTHAAESLERLLIQKSIPRGSDIYLHSSGGSLIGGMSLGRVIRAHGLNTHVARKGILHDGFQHTDVGCCMSAAALAFLGGEFRFIGTGSRYGVHRFTLGEPSAGDADEAQVLSASVVDYIRSMGVETELFSIASDCPTDDILELPHETLVRLNVVNNGYNPAKWTIESIEGALYLKGERDTIYGIQKFLIVFPSTGRMYIYVIFDGGQNAEAIMTMSVDHLVIDHELFPLHELRVSRLNDCGRINLMYQVTPALLTQLRKAKTIGYYLRHAEDAAMFVGYDSFHFEDAAARLAGLLGVYFRETDPDELALRASVIP